MAARHQRYYRASRMTVQASNSHSDWVDNAIEGLQADLAGVDSEFRAMYQDWDSDTSAGRKQLSQYGPKQFDRISDSLLTLWEKLRPALTKGPAGRDIIERALDEISRLLADLINKTGYSPARREIQDAQSSTQVLRGYLGNDPRLHPWPQVSVTASTPDLANEVAGALQDQLGRHAQVGWHTGRKVLVAYDPEYSGLVNRTVRDIDPKANITIKNRNEPMRSR